MSVDVCKRGNILTIEYHEDSTVADVVWECATYEEAIEWRKDLVHLYAPQWLAQGIRMWHALKEVVGCVNPCVAKYYTTKAKYGKGLISHCALCHIHRMMHGYRVRIAHDDTIECRGCPLVTCASEADSAYHKVFYGYTIEERLDACDVIIEAHYEMARRLGVNVSE